MLRLSFYPVGESLLLVAGAAAVLVLLLFAVPARGGLTPRRRWVLAAIRLGIVLLVIAAMLRPTLIFTETRRQAATLVLLLDRSRSMDIPDGIGGRTRWQALTEALAAAEAPLRRLESDFEVRAYTFDAALHPAELSGGRVALPEVPDGDQTAIGAALDDILQLEAGKRLLGVVLLSDGAQRAYAPRDLAPQVAAGRLAALGFPLYTIPFGQARGLGQARDVAVEDLVVNDTVFVKNELAVTAQVRVDGYVNREIPVRLAFETAPGRMEVVDQQVIRATTGEELIPVRLSYAPPVPGEFKLVLSAAPQPGELVTTNNELSTFVNVLAGGLNVLYLEGDLRVEQRFLRTSLDASPDINVDYVRLDPRRPQTRPGDLRERLQPGAYDVYMIGDVDASAFRQGELGSLAEAVSQGAGLIMLGGLQSFGAGGYAETPLADVLPVEMDRLERQPLDGPIRSDLHLPGPLRIEPTQQGLRHFVLLLAAPGSENASAWASLPRLRGANRLRDPKPGAVVLAATEQQHPLLVSQVYGDGRVLAFAADSTWQWWMQGFENAHRRFWRQIVLWLARKDDLADGDVWVRLAKRRYSPTERVEFTVGARSPEGEPLHDAEFSVEVVPPEGSGQPVTLIRQEGESTGTFRETQRAGDYTVRVSASHGGDTLGSAEARFLVHKQDLELDNPAADVSTMESLAASTGGETLAPEQLPRLLERLTEDTETVEIVTEARQTFWDSWPFFLCLVTLMGVEWFLRKRWGLV